MSKVRSRKRISRTEDYCTGVFKCPCGNRRFEKELFGHWILGQAVVGAVGVRPEGGYDDDFRFAGYQFSKCFWKSEIPADEYPHRTKGRLNHFVWGVG